MIPRFNYAQFKEFQQKNKNVVPIAYSTHFAQIT